MKQYIFHPMDVFFKIHTYIRIYEIAQTTMIGNMYNSTSNKVTYTQNDVTIKQETEMTDV
jgi:hypothetical protein